MGWPIMLSTKDRPAFIENVYNTKQRIFKQMAATGDIPLREGVPEFIDELLEDGIRPIIIAGTSSAPEDSVVSCAMLNLGPSRAFKTQVLYLGSAADVKSALTKKSEGGGTDKDDDDLHVVRKAVIQADPIEGKRRICIRAVDVFGFESEVEFEV